MFNYSYSSTNVSANINSWSNPTSFSTGITFPIEETEEEARIKKKELIKSIIDNDKYLLQEIITELRKEKLDQLKDGNK